MVMLLLRSAREHYPYASCCPRVCVCLCLGPFHGTWFCPFFSLIYSFRRINSIYDFIPTNWCCFRTRARSQMLPLLPLLLLSVLLFVISFFARARNISTHWFLSVEQSRWTKCFSNNIILKMNQQFSTVSKRYYSFYGLHTRVRDSRAFAFICMCITWSCVTQFVRSKNPSIFPMNCVCRIHFHCSCGLQVHRIKIKYAYVTSLRIASGCVILL